MAAGRAPVTAAPVLPAQHLHPSVQVPPIVAHGRTPVTVVITCLAHRVYVLNRVTVYIIHQALHLVPQLTQLLMRPPHLAPPAPNNVQVCTPTAHVILRAAPAVVVPSMVHVQHPVSRPAVTNIITYQTVSVCPKPIWAVVITVPLATQAVAHVTRRVRLLVLAIIHLRVLKTPHVHITPPIHHRADSIMAGSVRQMQAYAH